MMKFYDQQGKDAWIVNFTVQREYRDRIEKRMLYQFSHLVWADGVQNALDTAVAKYFESQPLGAVLLPDVRACRVVTRGSGRDRDYLRSNRPDDPGSFTSSGKLCSVQIHQMKAMSGQPPTEWVSVEDEPDAYSAIQMPATLRIHDGGSGS